MAIVILAAAIGLNSCDQPGENPVSYDDLGWKKGIYLMDGKPFNGVAQQTHADGSTKGRWEFRNGVPHGKIIEFDETGTKIAETHYRHGLRHGENRYWDKTGSLIKFQIFDSGKLISDEHSDSLGDSEDRHP